MRSASRASGVSVSREIPGDEQGLWGEHGDWDRTAPGTAGLTGRAFRQPVQHLLDTPRQGLPCVTPYLFSFGTGTPFTENLQHGAQLNLDIGRGRIAPDACG